MLRILPSFVKSILDLIYPAKCISCGLVGDYICPSCFQKYVHVNETTKCIVCDLPTESAQTHRDCFESSFVDSYIAFCKYESVVKELMYQGKYRFSRDIYKFLGKLLINHLFANSLDKNISKKTIVTSVPLHPKKLRDRGFNQAEIVAKVVASRLNCPYVNLLERSVHTSSQVTKGKDDRELNLLGAFKLTESGAEALTEFDQVILVDDILTTGATINLCAGQIKKQVDIQTIALVVASER